MSLLHDAFESFVIYDKQRVPDGYGGTSQEWVQSVEVEGAMVFNDSVESKIAQAQGVTSVYTFTSRKNVILQYHDVLKRVRDGKIFRVTSDGDDKFTPVSATLNMRQVTCEEWELD